MDRTSDDVVERFLAAVEAGDMTADDIWTDDVELDATVPNWRFRVTGVEAIRREYAGWFADPGQLESLRRYATPDGAVVEYLLRWIEDGVPHAAHHVHLLTLREGRIAADLVLCGGRWPAELMAQMEEAGA